MTTKVVTIDQSSLNMTLGWLHQLRGGRKRSTLKRGLTVAGETLKKRIVKNSSYRDHSLQDLRRRNHPYAARRGRITIHTRHPYVVHTRKGKFVKAIKGKYVSHKTSPYYKVWIDQRFKYPKWIITGTKVMMPRDTLYMTMQERGTNRAMLFAVASEMGKELRTKVFIKFR